MLGDLKDVVKTFSNNEELHAFHRGLCFAYVAYKYNNDKAKKEVEEYIIEIFQNTVDNAENI